MTSLLARSAGQAFWMARYMERAENLARILDINKTFAGDSEGAQDWLPIVQLNADEARFSSAHAEASAESVVFFYVLDRDNPGSILWAVRMARENARALRPLISTEMWVHLNVFYDRLRALEPRDLTLADLSRLWAMIKENCQTHAGMTEGTFFRDQGWHFYTIGKYVERADQTSRLLDIKYRFMHAVDETLRPRQDASQWNALLRSVAGYHAFRRVYPRDIRAPDVVAFLLLDEDFPRSIALCIDEVDGRLNDLVSDYGLAPVPAASQAIGELRGALHTRRIDEVLDTGLHAFVDEIQIKLATLTDEMSHAYFGT